MYTFPHKHAEKKPHSIYLYIDIITRTKRQKLWKDSHTSFQRHQTIHS